MKKITILIALVSVPLFALAMLTDFTPVSRAQTPINRIYGKFYQLDVAAETGQNDLVNILDGVSINDSGTIAFAAQIPSGEGVFVSNDVTNTPFHITPGFQTSGRLFGKPVQINNQGWVATRDRISGDSLPTRMRIWDSANPGNFVSIANGGNTSNPYSTLLTFPSLNNNVAGTGSILGNFVFGGVRQTGETVVVTPNIIPVTNDAASRNEAFVGAQRPMIADDGKIVMRAATEADGIRLYDNNLGNFSTIASHANFSLSPQQAEFGLSPGISDNGNAVAFYANLTSQTTASTLNTNIGRGIFLSLDDGTPQRKIIRIAGRHVEDVFHPGDFDEVCDTNEQCINAELGVDANGNVINFADAATNRFEKDSRTAVIHMQFGAAGITDDTFIVSFIATPNHAHEKGFFSDQKGLWTVRVDVHSLPDGTLNYEVSRPIPVIQKGNKIGARTIDDIRVYDPLTSISVINGANHIERPGDHRVAFWATTTGGGQIIVRATQLDYDGDALYDHWERHGIDFDGDGTLDFTIFDPNEPTAYLSPDVYLEIDSMTNWSPPDESIQMVKDAFANAPGDGSNPINLHILNDSSEIIQEYELTGYTNTVGNCPANAIDFDFFYNNNFGTATEQNAGAKVLNAKRLVYRYALFVDKIADKVSNGVCSSSALGLAGSYNSDSFMVGIGSMDALTLASCAGNACPQLPRGICGFYETEASTLMHELGHTLGLRHGGFDNENNKPNYLSIMSYSYSKRVIDPDRPLNYSNSVLPPLNENALDENEGIGDPSPFRMVIWTDSNGARKARRGNILSNVDWNANGNATETGIIADINNVVGHQPSGVRNILRGHNDWANLKFNFRNSLTFNQTKPLSGMIYKFNLGKSMESDLSREQIFSDANSVDTDGDGVSNFYDNCPGTPNPGQVDRNGNGNGDACDFAPTAANVSVAGRISDVKGQGIGRVSVSLTDSAGITRTAQTNSFGNYKFDAVPAGQTYIISVNHKKYVFSPDSQVLNVSENLSGIDFTADE